MSSKTAKMAFRMADAMVCSAHAAEFAKVYREYSERLDKASKAGKTSDKEVNDLAQKILEAEDEFHERIQDEFNKLSVR